LDQLDTRAPVPLLPMMAHHQKQNMRDHLVAIRDIVRGLADHDDRAVEEAARRISYSDEMGQMCTRMGAGAPGFAEQSIRFHHTADDIVEAANRHDRAGVLRELSATLQACTACHAVWKQRVVDVATWQRPTAHEAADDRAR
jgi:cytochrome c556